MNDPQAQLNKLRKILDGTVPDELDALDREELTQVIARCEDNVREQETALSDNEQITATKATLKEMVGPFRDAIKYQRAKQRYAAIMRELKGGTS